MQPAGLRARIGDPSSRRAVQAGVATAVAGAIGGVISSVHESWATLSAYLVLGDTDGETLVNGARRVLGTVAGAVVGFAIALSDVATLPVALAVLAIAVFGSSYYRPVARGATTFWTTLLFAMLYEYLGRLTTVALELRILETLLGAFVALVVAYLVLPTHTRTAMSEQLAVLVDDVQVIVTGTLGRLAGTGSTAGTELRERILQAQQHVNRVADTSAPLRTSITGPDIGVLDDQMTAAWSLAHHIRVLVRAANQAEHAGATIGAEDGAVLARVTAQNATALRVALQGGLPRRVDDDPGRVDPDLGTSSPELDRVLREVDRINETLLVMLDNTSPGARGEDDETEERRP